MAKIRHVAISTEDPEKTAAWYKEVFGLVEVGKSPNGVYLSDGEINFAVLRIKSKDDPYECGLPSEIQQGFRFGISFYLIAMLFILFDIEVVFLYPVGVILRAAHSVFVLVEVGIFVVLLLVALAYVWRRGALDWR